MGWRLRERKSFLERAKADAFLALALVHHVAISGNVPLPEYVALLGQIAPRGVTEFVTKEDPMVKRLLMRREDVFPDYTLEAFRAALAERFTIAREERSGSGTRVLFELG